MSTLVRGRKRRSCFCASRLDLTWAAVEALINSLDAQGGAMKKYISLALLLTLVLIAEPNQLWGVDEPKPASQEDWSVPRESIGRRLRELLDRLKENFIFEVSGEDRAPISLMLRNRERLSLTADQVKQLEQLRNDFAKESIRSEANLRIAEMDLTSVLEAQPVDMTKAEAKVREIERIRGDLRIARIRSIEKGKAQLSAEQRRKLQELQADQNFAGLEFKSKP
jgi:hypothetical protein